MSWNNNGGFFGVGIIIGLFGGAEICVVFMTILFNCIFMVMLIIRIYIVIMVIRVVLNIHSYDSITSAKFDQHISMKVFLNTVTFFIVLIYVETLIFSIKIVYIYLLDIENRPPIHYLDVNRKSQKKRIFLIIMILLLHVCASKNGTKSIKHKIPLFESKTLVQL